MAYIKGAAYEIRARSVCATIAMLEKGTSNSAVEMLWLPAQTFVKPFAVTFVERPLVVEVVWPPQPATPGAFISLSQRETWLPLASQPANATKSARSAFNHKGSFIPFFEDAEGASHWPACVLNEIGV